MKTGNEKWGNIILRIVEVILRIIFQEFNGIKN